MSTPTRNNQCAALAVAQEIDWPPVLLRCTRPRFHRGMHEAAENNIDWEWRPLDGPAMWLKGDARFAWFNGRCWWSGVDKFISDPGTDPVEPVFAMREIDV